MNNLHTDAKKWLAEVLGPQFTAQKHIHSHQDEVYSITTPNNRYYLKSSRTLQAEHDNLKKLEAYVPVPRVIDFYHAGDKDYLLISELPGKNLVELIAKWPKSSIVNTFAQAIKWLHQIDVTKIFPEAGSGDVLLHGDMALPNVIIAGRGDDQKDIGYIDFGQLTYGPPELDIVDAIWSLQRNLGPNYGELFLQKYDPVVRTPAIEKMLAFRYQPPAEQ